MKDPEIMTIEELRAEVVEMRRLIRILWPEWRKLRRALELKRRITAPGVGVPLCLN